jgi:flagellar hook-length control protein FliK
MVPAQALSRVLAAQPVLDAVERDQAAPRAAFDHLKIGQLVTGVVKSQSKGTTLVTIDGQTVAMRLPRTVQTGETLKLSFAGRMPQAVFMLDASETASIDAPELSQTARMLSEIMQRVPERTLPTLTPATPMLAQPPANTAELALALRTALVRSGLFYESHLANWAVGQDSLDGLMREPQNRLAGEAALSLTTDTAPGKHANPLHTLLTQQLQVLESPHFAWRGDVWPGQTMEWQLRRETDLPDDQSHASAQNAETAGWESHLKLTLPQLGELDVHIRLDANQAFSIRMTPAQPEVAPLLQRNQARLTERLASAGCTLHAVTVTHDADA